MFVVAGLIVGSVALTLYFPYREEQEALTRGQYLVAEGPIANFQQGQAERPAVDQTFDVGEVRFDVEPYAFTGFHGFIPSNLSPQPDGAQPQFNGLRARISYLDTTPRFILRAEIVPN